MAETNDHYARDLYAELGVTREASSEELKAAYRRMAAKFHPDRVVGLSEAQRVAAEEEFKVKKEAYEILSDPSRRSDYHVGRADWLRSNTPRGGAASPPPRPESPPPRSESPPPRSESPPPRSESPPPRSESPPPRSESPPPPPEGSARTFAAGSGAGGPAAAAHSRKWGLKGLVVGGALAAWGVVEAYYALKKFTAPSLPTPASVLAAHQPSDPNAPGAVFMTRLQLDMTSQPRKRVLQDQLGISEAEASRIQRVFMGVRDVNNPNAETPYDKIAKAMTSEQGSVTITQPLKDGKTAEICVDGGQVSVTVETGDLKGTKPKAVFPHSPAIKAAFAPDRKAADIKVWDDHADRVSGRAIQFPISAGKAAAFIGDSVWKPESSYERSMATGDNTKRVFDDGRQFSEFWRKVLRDRVQLETGFASRGDVTQQYNLADGTKASIHITPQKVEFERIDPASGNKRSFVQETAVPDRLKLSEPEGQPLMVRPSPRPSP